jgi:hypothetical protein
MPLTNKGPADVYRMATARFVVQMANDPEVAAPAQFVSLITSERGLRRLGDVTARTLDDLAELGIDIEYGPALGALDSTLQVMLKQLVQRQTTITASEMFNYQQRDATQPELQAELARLEEESDDMRVPLKLRRELSDKANHLRKSVGG